MTALQIQQKEKSAQLMWTAFILLFFVIQAIVWIVALTLTAGDHSHAVVAGYDEQAMKWDDTQSLMRASEALGWQSQLLIDNTGDIKGNRAITLTLKDRELAAVAGAQIQLKAFHRGRAAEVQRLTLNEVHPGVYSGSVKLRHSGHWQFDGIADVNGTQYLIQERQFLDSGK